MQLRVSVFHSSKKRRQAVLNYLQKFPNVIVVALFNSLEFIQRDIESTFPDVAIVEQRLMQGNIPSQLLNLFPGIVFLEINGRPIRKQMEITLAALPDDASRYQKIHTAFEAWPASPTPSAYAKFFLSRRQQQVLRLIMEGYSYAAICENLGIRYETLRSHIKQLHRKLRVKHLSEMIAKAKNDRLV
jgi:DNA-binding CsgD family transcriptional regulator